MIDYLSYPETDTRKGESLSVSYRSENSYLPNFGISYDLTALNDGTCYLSIAFGTGTFWNAKANDYKFSYFYLDPLSNSNDSIYTSQAWYPFNYLDSLSLGSTKYRNLYYLPKGTWTGLGSVVYSCYYQIDKGIISFTDMNEEFWIKK